MEINRPITEEGHKTEDEDHKKMVRAQKAYFEKILNKFEAAKSDIVEVSDLTLFDMNWIIGATRAFSDSMSEIRKRPAGRPAKLPGELAMLFAFEVVQSGMKKSAAYAYFANQYDVSIEAVKKELKKQNYLAVLDEVKQNTT